MSISLNNINSEVVRAHRRIDELAGKINGSSFSDTGWINGSRSSRFPSSGSGSRLNPLVNFFRYRVKNGVMYIQISGVGKATNSDAPVRYTLGTFPNWTYGEIWFSPDGVGDQGGAWEGLICKVDSSGNVIDMSIGAQWRVFPGTVVACPV